MRDVTAKPLSSRMVQPVHEWLRASGSAYDAARAGITAYRARLQSVVRSGAAREMAMRLEAMRQQALQPRRERGV